MKSLLRASLAIPLWQVFTILSGVVSRFRPISTWTVNENSLPQQESIYSILTYWMLL